MKEIKLGKIAEKLVKVEEKDLAKNIKSGALAVLASPVLIAWSEELCCDMLEEYLENDETTVGTYVELFHNAPTPLGAEVKITSKLCKVNGREYSFEITAEDSAGEIAKINHKRFLVYGEKFQNKANSRKGAN